jgi:ribosomal protein S18 acetylase RimI-like enzyme
MVAVTVEAFTSDAASAIAELLQEHGWSDSQIKGQLEALAALGASEDGLALVAAEAGTPAAFISLQVHRWNRLAQIHGLAVRRELRRRSYATMLLEAAEVFARERECRGIYVDTPVNNEGGRAFYEGRGYHEDYRMTRYYADDLDGVTYVKFFDTTGP